MFISVEGIEGSGKSTLSTGLGKCIEQGLENDVILTREPGATKLGVELRNLLLQQDVYNTIQTSELLIFAADRAQHISEVIQPALDRSAFVISDRYSHSTFAYQGHGRGIDFGILETINNIATDGLKPDLVILLDLEVESGLKRAKSRGEDSWTSFEKEEIAFHQKIRDGFLEMASKEAERFLVLDANQSPEQLVQKAYAEVKRRYV